MLVAHAFLVLGLLVPAAQDSKKEKEGLPDPKRIDAAVAALDAAFKDGKSEQRIAALAASVDAPDARVVRALEKGLRDSDAAVQTAALDALGRIRHPDALQSLHGWYRSQAQLLKKDETLLPAVLKAIGRYGSDSSADLLAEDLFQQRSFPALQARVLALGNIRSTKGIEALTSMMVKVGPHKAQAYMPDVRLALLHITGVDNGPGSEGWLAWWQDKKSTFQVPKEEPKLPAEMQRKWDEYWGLPHERRGEKRERKGEGKSGEKPEGKPDGKPEEKPREKPKDGGG